MYGNRIDFIKSNLMKKEYLIANCDSQLEFVKKKYIEEGLVSDKILLDCRCPESINLLRENNLLEGFNVPMIEPILVRTSRILYEKYIKNNEDCLIITCPCTQLRDYAKECCSSLPNITFYTWKEFCNKENIELANKVDKSPIPLGYFRDSFTKICEVSSEKEILSKIKSIKSEKTKKYDIVEMLYCKDGCNNGDGL